MKNSVFQVHTGPGTFGLPRGFDRILDDLFDGFGARVPAQRVTRDFSPSIDVLDAGDAFVLKADLPGLTEADIDLTLEKDFLILKGEKKADAQVEESDRQGLHFERAFGSFARRFSLPAEIQRDEVTASFKNGVLTVRLPKTKEAVAEPRKIPIN